jgi:HAD superfamily hydrolase (TIGR01509 family)
MHNPRTPVMVRTVDWENFDAALLDLDGVITPTAEVHRRAWARMFTDFLADRGVAPYTDSDYFQYLDGRPRYDGVQALLVSRAIALPWGSPTDPPASETVCGLGNRKDNAFHETLAAEGIAPYPASVRFLDFLDSRGISKAVVSSSKNARAVLTAAGVVDRFPVIIDGLVAVDRKLPGKPAPDTFVYAAEQLGATRERSVVLEDAISGVRAAAAGGFGRVIGVDRGTGADALREAGAHRVVHELDELI